MRLNRLYFTGIVQCTLRKSVKRVSLEVTKPAQVGFKQKRKQDALALAELIYDMFVQAEADAPESIEEVSYVYQEPSNCPV